MGVTLDPFEQFYYIVFPFALFFYNEGLHIDTKCLGRSGSGNKYFYILPSTSPPCYHRIIKVGRDFQYHLVQLYVTLVIFPSVCQ